MRAREPVSCWPHKPCEWRSTRQPATRVWESRSTGGPLACNQQMRVQFPPLPPDSTGRFRQDGRCVLLAPSVTVAEWLRRAIVNRCTRVRFSPVTPFGRDDSSRVFHAGVVQRIRTPGYEPGDWRFESSRPHHFRIARYCRVAELVQRSIVTREDVGSNPTPTASSGVEAAMPGNSAGAETGPTYQHS